MPRMTMIIDRRNHEPFDFGMLSRETKSLCRNFNSFLACDRQSRVSLRDATYFRWWRYEILKTFVSCVFASIYNDIVRVRLIR